MGCGTIMSDYLRGVRTIDPKRNRFAGEKTYVEKLIEELEKKEEFP